MFDRNDCRQTLSDIVARQAADVLQELSRLGVGVDCPCQRSLQSRQVSSSVGVVDDVREAVDNLGIGIGPLQGNLDMHFALVTMLGTEDV